MVVLEGCQLFTGDLRVWVVFVCEKVMCVKLHSISQMSQRRI